MSKLAPSLKALINAPSARPGPTPAAKGIADVYARIAREAEGRNLGSRPWVAMSVRPPPAPSSPPHSCRSKGKQRHGRRRKADNIR